MDENLSNLSISELKKIKKENQKKLKKEYEELKKKQKLIEDIMKIQKTREKINKSQPKQPKIKTLDEYFQECIKNKKIPPDTPHYFRKALERAIREHEQGIEKEKSSLKEFANKYIIKPKKHYEYPLDFFRDILLSQGVSSKSSKY